MFAAAPAAIGAHGASGSTLVNIGVPALVPAGAVRVGGASGRARLSLMVALKPRDVAGLTQLLAAQSNPSSPLYRHYLRKGEFGRRFGATHVSIVKIERRLRAAGMRVGRVSGNDLLIPVTTTVSDAEKAFDVSLDTYRLSSRALAIANSTAPRFARSLASVVQSVVGLDGIATASEPSVRVVRDGSGPRESGRGRSVSDAVASGQPEPCVAGDDVLTLNAEEVAQDYGFEPLYETGDYGAGESIDLLEVTGYAAGSVAAFDSCYGVRPSIVTELPIGALPTPGVGKPPPSTTEADVDIEEVSSLAPRLAHVYVYEVSRTPPAILAGWSAIQMADNARVASVSAGFCEPIAVASGLIATENLIFKAMALQGQTTLAATGDSGSEGCDNGTSSGDELAVDDPASQPYVLGVGGTDIPDLGFPPGFPAAQTAWIAGGGGISSLYPIPSWQRSTTPGVINPYSSGTPCGLSSGHYCREVPDVSATGGTCITFDLPSGWSCVDGTSIASPLWASLTALIDDSSAACRSKAVGFMSPALYGLAVSTPDDFTDATTGNNDALHDHDGTYPATVGYDMATGLGAPEGANLAQSLCGGTLWMPPTTDDSVELSASPSIAASSDMLYTVGIDLYPSDLPSSIYFAGSKGGEFNSLSDGVVTPGGKPAASDLPPAIAVQNGNPVAEWTDFTTGKVETSSLLDGHWSSAAEVGDGRASSDAGPALAGDGSNLFAAWKAASTTNVDFSYDTPSGWTTPQQVPGATTNLRPAITYDAPLAAVIIGWTTPSNKIAYEVYSPLLEAFTEGETIPFASSPSGPAFAVVRDQLFEVHLGTTTNLLYYSSQPPNKLISTWTSDQSVPSTDTQYSPSVAVNGPTLFVAWKDSCGCSSPLSFTSSDPP